ncbi:glycosyltransferase [Microbacterium sp. SORGH_AS_0888]|uniref:glycosyltransferase n=1 Tax=Microbacterium sp. SORGH_AS_0888 TaxID=3041791 RepID=UPI00277FB860|nr:glycosyltransferase [Microbacterium sp. SORGH_AS_0888]MDQ1127874.1 glycosyltransferase involved in cell wall biosynthesis [Microbacterium sp. SORGH_AS_0888]
MTSSASPLETFSARETRLLEGALSFHALTAPGRELDVHLYRHHSELTPRTTDDRTFDGASRIFRDRIGTLRVKSLVPAEDVSVSGRASGLIEERNRHIMISPDSILELPPRRWVPRDPVRKALRAFRTRYPLAYDLARDLELLRFRRTVSSPAPRRDYAAEFAPKGAHEFDRIVPAPLPAAGAPRAVLLGLHWLEMGGAERWALECVRLVREAGMLPIVLTNVDSHHPFVLRPELDGALLIPFSEPTHYSQTPGFEQMLRGLLRVFDIRGVSVHHNQWLYDRLPWLKVSRPSLPVVDSTHIVEYRGGGYPRSGVVADRYIDQHHVISPSLERWFVDTQHVDAEHLVMAPLLELTVGPERQPCLPRKPEQPLAVAFIGRMSRQKSPEIFVAIAERAKRQGIAARFIMHGDGELDTWVDEMIESRGLSDVLERRRSETPVADTLDDADVLMVTSHNEGLTLTTLEAIAHGVPVVSSDVGAQRDLVPEEALFTSDPYRGVRQASALLQKIEQDDEWRVRIWETEAAREDALRQARSATNWFREEVSKW